ncbi:PREDICTED: uncharacterized protein LOC104702295 isoform X2 [Camelina sativa]|uniref:Uncharacterized protein LOC104702295 isoform X2 n=1 Tax=Camelina sativa TaxID=90675 RepID=A0ABM0SUT4_CAMSA|nr:PREDICTED: uncharacterized protein LOC104702295 isoform X2 [Camelina sativa]
MGIFWDIVDCEIPDGLSLDLVCENIKSALAGDGYRGKLSIHAYCEMKKSEAIVPSEFESSGIELVRAGAYSLGRFLFLPSFGQTGAGGRLLPPPLSMLQLLGKYELKTTTFVLLLFFTQLLGRRVHLK